MKKDLILLLIIAFSAISAQTGIPKAEDWNWVKYENNPVMPNGTDSSWDGASAYMPSVLKIDNMYHMWYAGASLTGKIAIGYASSSDGKNWTKYEGNPVLVPGGAGSWTNEVSVGIPEVYYDGETFHMWYFGFIYSSFVGEIGYASSPDGLNWTKHDNNPVLDTGDGIVWDNHFVGGPSIISEDNQYRVWYTGSSTWLCENIGTATSVDGLNWEKYNDPLMELCEGESIIWHPEVIKSQDGNYYMWYTEGPWGNTGFGPLGLSIRYASSTDGMVWNQSPGHFVLDKGESGDWDNTYMGFSSVLYDQENGLYEMWYSGASASGEHYLVGYASTPAPTDVNVSEILPDKYSLSQNYPNPFNPVTRIKYSIPVGVKSEMAKDKSVTLKIFDLLGREVATLVNEEQKPGNYEVVWNPSADGADQPSGVYFYRIISGEFSQVKKMLLLK